MGRAWGTAGGHIHRTRIRRFRLILGGYLVYSIVVAMLIWTLWPRHATSIWTLLFLGPLVLYVARRPLLDLMNPWLKGWTGEREVARVLAPLTSVGYEVLHDVDLGSGNVDHVVVGPTGIYAIETKAWSGRFYLGAGGRLMRSGVGAEKLRTQAVGAAMRVSRRLASCGIEQFVTAVIVVTRSSLPKGAISLRSAYVVEARALPTWINGRVRKLHAMDVERIRDALTPYVTI
jgi:hypothetical protein